MQKIEGLFNYGLAGIIIFILVGGYWFMWQYFKGLIKEIKHNRDEERKELLRRLEIYEDRENMRIRDVHEVMTDQKELIGSVVDIAKGIREILNILVERLFPERKSGL